MQQGCWCWYDALSSSGAMFCMRNVGGVEYILYAQAGGMYLCLRRTDIFVT